MTITKFAVKLNRAGHSTEYIESIEKGKRHTTTNPKLALLMGRLTAEETVKSIGKKAELVSVSTVT